MQGFTLGDGSGCYMGDWRLNLGQLQAKQVPFLIPQQHFRIGIRIERKVITL